MPKYFAPAPRTPLEEFKDVPLLNAADMVVPNEIYTCPACKHLLLGASTDCSRGHFVCDRCCEKIRQQGDGNCPVCLVDISRTSTPTRSPLVDELVAECIVRCQPRQIKTAAPEPNSAGPSATAAACGASGAAASDTVEHVSKKRITNAPDDASVVVVVVVVAPDRCDWTGRYADLLHHRKTQCTSAMHLCPYEACLEYKLLKDMPAHELICGSRMSACSYCAAPLSLRARVGHEPSCPHRSVRCPNTDCGEHVVQGMLTEHRKACPFEFVWCPICDNSVDDIAPTRRKNLGAHFKARHADAASVGRLVDQITLLTDERRATESEQCLARSISRATGKHNHVFNFEVPGGFGALSDTQSYTHRFTNEVSVASFITPLHTNRDRPNDLFAGITAKCTPAPNSRTVPVKFTLDVFVLTDGDETVFGVVVMGTNRTPTTYPFATGERVGVYFTPTEAMKKLCTSSTGSFRIRFAMCIFT
ncbi:hypothetical protein T484DRAFT_1754986 [Baffinella frigidus]|nr:hypothetical protein T484DRAFT_1754986 [Cryptophyta sp. CCMP2293]